MTSDNSPPPPSEVKKRNILILILGLMFIMSLYFIYQQRLPLTNEDGTILLGIAGSGLEGNDYQGPVPVKLYRSSPVFITVYRNGSEITSVGYTNPSYPLATSIKLLAEGLDLETNDTLLEITVMGSKSRLVEGDALTSGHGVLVSKEGFEGVLLPTAIAGSNLSMNETLQLAAQKAGFEDFEWSKFEVYSFPAVTFQG